jgi:hypothetical protein
MENNKQKYILLLEAILNNSAYIKNIATLILKESLNKNNEEGRALIAYANNFLFAFLDEIGKFYLIKKQYPKKIDDLKLKVIGFYIHNKKLSTLNEIIRKRQKRCGGSTQFTEKQTIEMLRNFKDTTLYIDYKNGQVKKPADSSTLKKDVFKSYVRLITILFEMAKEDIKNFELL